MIVVGQSAAKFSTILKTTNHTITSGLDASFGGGDQGMNPHELLQAALAACTIATLGLYNARKKWDVGVIEVSVSIVSEGKDASQLRREIKFSGKENEEQRKRLVEIADKCPVHLLLESKIMIETVIAS